MACYEKATEKLQATLRELEAAKVQLEAVGASPGSVGSMIWGIISHHVTECSCPFVCFLGYEL